MEKKEADAEWKALEHRIECIVAGLLSIPKIDSARPSRTKYKFKKRIYPLSNRDAIAREKADRADITKRAQEARKAVRFLYIQTPEERVAQEKADREEEQKRKAERAQNRKAAKRYARYVLKKRVKALREAQLRKIHREESKAAKRKAALEAVVAAKRKAREKAERRAARIAKQESIEAEENHIVQLAQERKLNIRNKQIFIARFEGLTLNEIANEFGITRERVRQICMRTLRGIAKLGHKKVLEIIDDNKHKGRPVWHGLLKE